MPSEAALLNNYLIVGAMLFGIGMVGVLCRRNMIVMFLSLEIMLQGVSLSLAAWSRFHNNFGGQMLVLFIIALAACESAIALALVLALFGRRGKLDILGWQQLREANQSAFVEPPTPPESIEPEEQMPRLAVAGLQPEIGTQETAWRDRL